MNKYPTIIFIDLDDTVFQTKRRNINGLYQATNTKDEDKKSFMTEKQKKFFDIFFNNNDIKIVALTARNKEQYDRVLMKELIRDYSVSFSGQIYINNEISNEWNIIINKNFNSMNLKLEDIYLFIKENLNNNFNIILVDNLYISLKHKDVNSFYFDNDKKNILNIIKENINNEYYIHDNNNNIAIVPKFLDKKYACQYFIEKYNPDLTIGIADSITDFNFMNICDYKIIPSKTQLDYFLNKLFFEKISEI